ncbi:MAG: sirohydrochlorin chelatase [Actinocatenispora sp.]
MSSALVLLAHGSRDPRSAAAIEALVRRIVAARPGLRVAAAYLEHLGRRPAEVFRSMLADGATDLVTVPLLLTAAYHGTVDVPAVLAAARDELPVGVRLMSGHLLGPDERLLDALDAGLVGAGVSDVDGLVLGAAGTRDVRARATIDAMARRLGMRYGVPCVPGYAAGPGPDVPAAIGRLRSAGVRRIAVASYFLAPGLLHDRIVLAARAAGAVPVTEPFAATASVAGITLDRYDACRSVDSTFGLDEIPAAQGIRLPMLVS